MDILEKKVLKLAYAEEIIKRKKEELIKSQIPMKVC